MVIFFLKAQLQGFGTSVQQNIRLTTTTRLAIDLIMKPSSVEEEVTVVAQSPTVDVKSTETASVTLSNEILRNIPYNQFTANIVNLAPGVTDNSAYGAAQDTGIAYSMDGVNVSDPEGGSAWVFLDHNIIEEAKVMGLGLPAEYGNFTGVIFNLVTKSGGNVFSGHFEFDFQGKPGEFPKGLWQTVNNNNYADGWPDVTSPINKLFDVNGHLGGPLLKDKLWFYVGLPYYETWFFPTGLPEARNYYQPRSFWKLSSQLSPKTNAMFSLEVDTYYGVNRAPFGFVHAEIGAESTVTQKSPEVVGSLTMTHILSPKTFLDFKAAYFWGYYYLEPKMGRDVNAHFDLNVNKLLANSYRYYLADRSRLQVNASVTHYAEDFIKGDQDFKFGVELERSGVRSRFGYTGTNHMIKVQATYVLPFEVNFSAYFHSITGRAWTTRYRTSSSLLNQGRETVFVEPRGSNHYKMANGLDLRLEKTFMLSKKYRLGVILDVFNVLNDDTIDDWGTRIDYDCIPGEVPSTGGHELFSFVDPRAARVGIRLIF